MFEGQSRTESSSSFHERPMSLRFLKVKTKSSQNKGNLFLSYGRCGMYEYIKWFAPSTGRTSVVMELTCGKTLF